MTLPFILKLNHSFYNTQADLIASNYKKFTGKALLEDNDTPSIQELFTAPLIILSHGVEDDPLFNFSSQRGLDLFDYDFEDFILLPSRKSAEMVEREERDSLFKEVEERGFITNYRGIRVTSTGKRFYIENALIWNLTDRQGRYYGQAAAFSKYTFL